MKKVVVFVVLAMISTAVFAQINLGEFPLGTWLDPNYDAYWVIDSNNISITDGSGDLYFDFGGATLENFQIRPTTEGLTVSFYCVETDKTYALIKPLAANTDVILRIVRDELPDYELTMKRQ